jgi:hypothetical protein
MPEKTMMATTIRMTAARIRVKVWWRLSKKGPLEDGEGEEVAAAAGDWVAWNWVVVAFMLAECRQM